MYKKKAYYFLRSLILFGSFIISSCSNANQAGLILPGAYQLNEYLPDLETVSVGLVINHTSLIEGVNLVDTLLTRDVHVTKIYTPEHGFKGTADAGASVADDSYSVDKIPVISLYGNKRKPSAADLAGISIMVFDLQDVGVRFYTYISTLHYVMEACAENNIPLIVLDRPNPNGYFVDGPVLKEEFSSFVGMHPVPLVYGMTIGEYAQMINGEFWLNDSIQCDLKVVNCKNYSHKSFYSLPIAPSPNLNNMQAISLYPSTGLFEGTILSEGRGTEAPFQLIGHPDFSNKSISFTPKSIPGASLHPKLKGEECFGIDLRNIPIDTIRSWRSINLDYLFEFYLDLNKGESFFIDYITLLAGTDKFQEQILAGMNTKEIHNSWKEDLLEFNEIRVKYLLYPDFE